MPRTERTIPEKITPFTIIQDSNEQSPYTFTGIPVDGDRHDRKWVVPVEVKPLYKTGTRLIEIDGVQYSKGLADYSIKGFEEQIQIERKSLSDFFSTLGSRRDSFEAEIKRLNECEFAAVVIEAELSQMASEPPREMSVKTVYRTMISWRTRYPRVHWITVPGRRFAEVATYYTLFRWWQKKQGEIDVDMVFDGERGGAE